MSVWSQLPGFNSSMLDVQTMLNDYQIAFLQETWSAKQQLDNLSSLGGPILYLGRQTVTLILA